MHLADDRRDVVLAMRFEPDVLQHDDLVIAVGFFKGALQQRHRVIAIAAEELGVGANDPVGGADEPLAIGIVTCPPDQGTDRFEGFLAVRPLYPQGLLGARFPLNRARRGVGD